ncbi:MAG: 16S rRNA (guanine(527)-N(7))-methyltransferase RsmG [Oscillospiraceae bacterium]
MIPMETLRAGLASFGLTADERQAEQFDLYGQFLLEYNEKVNLTAILDPEEIAVKHFVDSAAVAGLAELPVGASLIDVGTGAGFPGVPLKILRPDLSVTLLDSLQKRLLFLELLSQRLGQKNALVHARAEQAGADPALRARYDFAASRAVAQLAVLCEYCLPLLKVGGTMLALKGPDCGAELEAARRAITLLGGGEPKAQLYRLPDGSGRTLITVQKIAQTPAKYPRQRVKLAEKPLR